MKSMRMRLTKRHIVCILVLLFATILPRVIIVVNTPFLYAQDAYLYLREARDFASTGTINFKERMPFTLSLGIFIKIFAPLIGEILASRTFMIFASSLMVIAIYLVGLRMSGSLLGLLAGLLASFEPYVLQWSTVPYTEVFAIFAGLVALYFAIAGKTLQNVLSLIFYYTAVATRPELYLPFALALSIIIFSKISRIRSKEGIMSNPLRTSSYILALCLYVLPGAIIYLYAQSWGVLGPVQRLGLFLTPELLSTTLELTFRFYDQQLLNQIISACVGLVLGLLVFNVFVQVSLKKVKDKFPISVQYRGGKHIKDTFFSRSGIIVLCLFFIFVTYIIGLTVFAYGYNWAFYVSPSDMSNLEILRSAIIIIPRLPVRYLILPRLLIGYPLVYPLVVIARKVQAVVVHEK